MISGTIDSITKLTICRLDTDVLIEVVEQEYVGERRAAA